MAVYLQLYLEALIPVLVTVVFYALTEKTGFGKIKYSVRQTIIGVVFGLVAVIGTEYGVNAGTAQVNVRDAAPLCAGLIFGGPAGIIAGVIGGVERWFAVYWGVGSYTRLACSVSTILAGLYAAFLRKKMFDDKWPNPVAAIPIGIVMEVFHMLMVFLTHPEDSLKAYQVVRVCTGPMVSGVGLSVFLSVLVICGFSEDKEMSAEERNRITFKIQIRMLLAVLVAFALTSLFTFGTLTSISRDETRDLFTTNLRDVQNEITEASDNYFRQEGQTAAKLVMIGQLPDKLQELAEAFGMTDINLVTRTGIIVSSTNPDFIGYDMRSGTQSAEFMKLTTGSTLTYVQEYQPLSYAPSESRKYVGVKIPGGFAQFGYDGDRLQDELEKQVRNMTVNRHIGESGYMVIIDEDGREVSNPYGDRSGESYTSQAYEIAQNVRNMAAEYELFEYNDGDDDCYIMYTMREGYFIFALQPIAEATQSRDIEMYITSFIEVLLFALLYTLIFFIIRKLVVRGIDSVNASLAQITSGNLEEKVNVRNTYEFSALSDGINTTVDTLKDYIQKAAERMKADLELAKNIQMSSLPNVFPPFPDRKEFDLYASMDPAKEVGGDFYDYYWLDENRLVLEIADVSGKGIPGAMFMMRAKTILKSLMESGLSVEEALTRANDELCEGNDAEMFVTAWLGVLDVTTGHVEYANAGHNPPVLMQDGTFAYLKQKPGFVLAGMEGLRYKKQELDIAPGAVFYLYTDGVPEATDLNGQLYGEERLLQCLNANADADMKALCEKVTADTAAFVGEADQFDDMTMVAIRYFGGEKQMMEMHTTAELNQIPIVTEWVDRQLEALKCPMKAQMQIDVAIDELFSNIARYAYSPDVGPATVRVEVQKNPQAVIITFLDHGVPFDPLAKTDPDVTLSAAERDIGGLGIFLVKKTMDDVKYEYKNGQNILSIKKRIGESNHE